MNWTIITVCHERSGKHYDIQERAGTNKEKSSFQDKIPINLFPSVTYNMGVTNFFDWLLTTLSRAIPKFCMLSISGGGDSVNI